MRRVGPVARSHAFTFVAFLLTTGGVTCWCCIRRLWRSRGDDTPHTSHSTTRCMYVGCEFPRASVHEYLLMFAVLFIHRQPNLHWDNLRQMMRVLYKRPSQCASSVGNLPLIVTQNYLKLCVTYSLYSVAHTPTSSFKHTLDVSVKIVMFPQSLDNYWSQSVSS